jgi:uncharacterized protein YcfL
MKKIALIFSILLLVGCSTTVPVARKFPSVPSELLEKCLELDKVPADTKQLSVTAEVVIKNYSKYHSCKGKVSDWQQWYESQKQIFDSVN